MTHRTAAAQGDAPAERSAPADTSAPALTAWLNQFFESYYRYRPVNATFVGVHAYDDRLPDYSEQGMAAVLGDAQAQLERLEALPAENLSASEALDGELARGFLEIQRWESRSAHFGFPLSRPYRSHNRWRAPALMWM